MLHSIMQNNLPGRYLSAMWLKRMGKRIKLMAGGGLMVYLAIMLMFTTSNRCTIYGLGHKAMVNTYAANVKIYYHGEYIRTIATPGTYRIGMANASNYTCK